LSSILVPKIFFLFFFFCQVGLSIRLRISKKASVLFRRHFLKYKILKKNTSQNCFFLIKIHFQTKKKKPTLILVVIFIILCYYQNCMFNLQTSFFKNIILVFRVRYFKGVIHCSFYVCRDLR
jgi:hypothetical protein